MAEMRGVWIHETTCRGLGGARVAEECHRHGMNLLLPKVPWLSGPTADPEYWEGVMGPMISRAHELGMEVHAWIFFLNQASVDNDLSLMQVMESGKVEYAACPANPETVSRNLEKIAPILEDYDLDGFNLEDCFVYHRWPKDPLICFCEYCRSNAPEGFDQRMEWNRRHLTDMLERIVREARKHSSKLKISVAARVPYDAHAMPMSADWKDWCDRGLLDYLAPMVYKKENDEVRRMAIEAMELAAPSKVPVYIGLGAYVLDRELTGHDLPAELSEQIEIVRELGAAGHILYHLGGITLDQFILMERAYSR
jgi:uncharacterized lipoprotein YddW (UPF0748 family)